MAARWVALALVFYGLAALFAAGVADSMLYHPDVASRQAPEGMIRIKLDDGSSIAAVYYENPGARFTLWHFHGNAEDLGDIVPRLREFQNAGFSVFAYDYPGYGLSGGKPGEKDIYAANAAALRHLGNELKVPVDRVILHGRSLGGGPAVDLASRERFAGLILESTFTSAYRVMTRWPILPGDQFRNEAKLPRVTCPILIVHGDADEVIPFHHALALEKAAPGKVSRLWVERAGHNNLIYYADERYWEAIGAFRSSL